MSSVPMCSQTVLIYKAVDPGFTAEMVCDSPKYNSHVLVRKFGYQEEAFLVHAFVTEELT